jgi:SAM-dependent methyltransferase
LKRVLYAGSGFHHVPPEIFPDWEEVRLDIDLDTDPDVVASITDLGILQTGTFAAIYSAHTLEHIYPHEVPKALREFRRVLTDDGFALIFVPNLEGLTLSSNEVLYESVIGPVYAFDMIYGFRADVAAHPNTMAHHTGFTAALLKGALLEAGFSKVTTRGDGAFKWNLMAIAQK